RAGSTTSCRPSSTIRRSPNATRWPRSTRPTSWHASTWHQRPEGRPLVPPPYGTGRRWTGRASLSRGSVRCERCASPAHLAQAGGSREPPPRRVRRLGDPASPLLLRHRRAVDRRATSVGAHHRLGVVARLRDVKAIVLAAGYGRRMRPLTEHTHKTLLEVGGRTVIRWLVDSLL